MCRDLLVLKKSYFGLKFNKSDHWREKLFECFNFKHRTRFMFVISMRKTLPKGFLVLSRHPSLMSMNQNQYNESLQKHGDGPTPRPRLF